MSTHKHFNKICYAVLAVTLAITILFMNGKSIGIPVMASEDANNTMFTSDDLNSDWNTSNATEIILSDNNCTVNGNGAYEHNGDIYIAYAGQYILSGALSDGRPPPRFSAARSGAGHGSGRPARRRAHP